MERLLVTGIDFPLGSNLALTLADHCEVFGLHGDYAVESPEMHTARWMPGDRIAVKQAIQEHRPQWIIHCPALSASSWDRVPSEPVADGEPQFVAELAELASDAAARLTVLSSDVVFAGPRMFHEETWPAGSPAPRAAQVLAMERALESRGALVVRTHAFGWSPAAGSADFAQRALESLKAGTSLTVDGRRHATPILATDLAELLLRAFELRLHGLYHLAGAERTSPWGFVSELAAAAGLRWPGGRGETSPPAATEWHDDTSLNSKRGRRVLEMATPMLREGLDRFVAQATGGWRDRLRVVGHSPSERELAA